jgi:hypothetical protein
MLENSSTPSPWKFDLEVPADGRLQVPVPLPPGSQVTVYVTEQGSSDMGDVLRASASSTDFWDNPFDDEDWNNA